MYDECTLEEIVAYKELEKETFDFGEGPMKMTEGEGKCYDVYIKKYFQKKNDIEIKKKKKNIQKPKSNKHKKKMRDQKRLKTNKKVRNYTSSIANGSNYKKIC